MIVKKSKYNCRATVIVSVKTNLRAIFVQAIKKAPITQGLILWCAELYNYMTENYDDFKKLKKKMKHF